MDENTSDEQNEISDAEYRHICRHNVKEDLATLASPEAQLEYHRQAPVDIATEMACTWFDHHYRLNEPAFVTAFSDEEWKALADFSARFENFTDDFDYQKHPEISGLLQRPDWKRVIKAAKIALAVFEENGSG